MNVIDNLVYFTETSLALYAAYVVLGSLAFGIFVWRRVYAAPEPVERRLRTSLHDSDSNAR